MKLTAPSENTMQIIAEMLNHFDANGIRSPQAYTDQRNYSKAVKNLLKYICRLERLETQYDEKCDENRRLFAANQELFMRVYELTKNEMPKTETVEHRQPIIFGGIQNGDGEQTA